MVNNTVFFFSSLILKWWAQFGEHLKSFWLRVGNIIAKWLLWFMAISLPGSAAIVNMQDILKWIFSVTLLQRRELRSMIVVLHCWPAQKLPCFANCQGLCLSNPRFAFLQCALQLVKPRVIRHAISSKWNKLPFLCEIFLWNFWFFFGLNYKKSDESMTMDQKQRTLRKSSSGEIPSWRFCKLTQNQVDKAGISCSGVRIGTTVVA